MSNKSSGCFKQKTAYELRMSDWSSDVCSSDLLLLLDAADGLDGQAQAALVVGLDDLDADLLADLEHIVDVGDAVVGDFGDVQQAVAARQHLHDGAEIEQAQHRAIVDQIGRAHV